MRQSVHSETTEAPPMPDDLLDEVLDDLGVRKLAVPPPNKESLLDRFLNAMRKTPVAWGIAAAAACLAVVATVKLGIDNNEYIGNGTRNGGNKTVIVKETPLLIFYQPTEELLREATKFGLNEKNLRTPSTQNDLERLIAENGRDRMSDFKPSRV